MEKVSNEDLDTYTKLLEWSEKKFQNKVNEKTLGDIALTQVALENKVEDVKKVLEKIFSLYTRLCNPSLFTQETKSHILSLESQINSSGAKLPMIPAQNEKHFRTFASNPESVSYIIRK